MMRSSQRGTDQARSPSTCSRAGTSVNRTRNASANTPLANPSAIGLMTVSPEAMKNAKTEIMMMAAAVTTGATCVKP